MGLLLCRAVSAAASQCAVAFGEVGKPGFPGSISKHEGHMLTGDALDHQSIAANALSCRASDVDRGQ